MMMESLILDGMFFKKGMFCAASVMLPSFTEGTVQVGDEVSGISSCRKSSASSMISSLANPWRFFDFIHDHLQGDDGNERKVLFLRGIFHIEGYQPVMHDIHVLGGVQQE